MAAALVQTASNNATSTANLSVGSGQGWATPTSGNLILAWANGNVTVTGPAGYTAGPSVVNGNGVYMWYKVSAGTETTASFTHTASWMTVGLMEYSGLTATPFDVQSSSTQSTSSGTSTASASVTTTNAIGGVVVALAGLHGFATLLTGPSWTNSFTNQQSVTTSVDAFAATSTFVGHRIVSSNAAYATVCSWTNGTSDQQELIIGFKAAVGAAALINLTMAPITGY